MLDCPGRVSRSRRLQRDLAKKVAKQVADAVELMHAARFVHGDLTTSHVLFCAAESVQNWSDSDVYDKLGYPETENVRALDRSPSGPHAPAQLVAPADARLTDPTLLQEDILLIDFGQSFSSLHPPADYKPVTVVHYQPPEARFEGTIGAPSDVWQLACTIFEIRAGLPLFEAFLGGEDKVFKEIVATLGKLPEPWWGAFANRHRWFDEDGEPMTLQNQQTPLPVEKTSIKQKLAHIGERDTPPMSGNDGPMMEQTGTRLDKAEIELLGDLLERMLRYLPQERMTMCEVVAHPWFSLE